MVRAPFYWRASLLALSVGCSDAPTVLPVEEPVRSFVLITLDTTRRDALGCYSRAPSPTPQIDRLASNSRVFEQARTVTPMTLPSHASMLTGLIPPRHTVRDNSHARLPEEALSVAEIAQTAGLRTAAIIAAPVLDPAFGLGQGFDLYDAPTQAEALETGRHGGRLANDITTRGLRFLDDVGDEPFFLWLHYFDPHEVYEPAPVHLKQAGGDPYLGEIAQMDAGVGAFLDALGQRGLMQTTAVLLTADHGEALGDHGEQTHSTFVYDATLAVPFLLYDPQAAAGSREISAVSVVDVAPTIAAALGLPAPSGIDGSNLWRHGSAPREHPVYFESLYGAGYFGWAPLTGLVLDGRKYIHSSTPEEFDVACDPDELQTLHDAVFAEHARELLRVELERPRLAQVRRSDEGPSVAQLQALGYVGAGLEASGEVLLEFETEGRPSPHECAELLARIRLVLAMHSRGERAATIPLLRDLLDAEPNNPTVLSLLGQNLRSGGLPEHALPHLERFAAVGPAWASTWLELARTYVTLDRGDDALGWYERALEQQRSPQLAMEIARVFKHLGRADEGLTWLAERGFATQRPTTDAR